MMDEVGTVPRYSSASMSLAAHRNYHALIIPARAPAGE